MMVSGVIFALGAQHQKLGDVSCRQADIEKKVDGHDSSITALKSDLKHIKEAVDEIKDEIKK